MQDTIISLMSFNAAGLNNPIKRCRLWMLVKEKQCDIFCCQETHMRKQEERYMKGVHSRVMIHVPATVKKRGILLGFANKLNWQAQDISVDQEEQYLIACGLIWDIKWLIVGIYVPQMKKYFFNQLIKKMEHYFVDNVIAMEDFNAVMDKKLDKSTSSSVNPEIMIKFMKWLLRNGLLDSWREEHLQT